MPERLPGCRGELILNLGRRYAKQLLLKLQLPYVLTILAGVFIEAFLSIGITAAHRLQAPPFEKLSDLMAGNAIEPAAKLALFGVVVPTSHGIADGQEHLLGEIRSIGI